MQQLTSLWQVLDPRKRLIVAVATVAMFAAVILLSNLASRPSMALLYAGLDSARAGEVVTALDQRGVPYEVRGDSIHVPAADRDQLRMTLAAEGLPANGGAGYELLDTLSGFGTTSQMFDAAYWRAKEGELARTIVSSPHIRSARVHIATPSGQPFRRDARTTASVSVSTNGEGLSPAHAKALRYLVAAAVAGMSPEDVSVIDGEAGLVLSGDESSAPSGDDRAAELKRNVERLLEARVGYGNAVVEVSVETVTEREAITERTFDPNSRVAISTDTEERTNTANDSRGGAVTVASNLPQGAAPGSGGSSQSEASETRERTNFEVSESTRELLRSPGAVKRLTVAVMVDGIEKVDASGMPTWEPRSEEELAALKDLVASAVGFDEARGDVITLKSMPFEPFAPEGSEAASGFLQSLDVDATSLVQFAVLAIVALILGLFVLRPILLSGRVSRIATLPPPGGLAPGSAGALTGEIDDGAFIPGNMPVVSDFADVSSQGVPIAMGAGDFGGFGAGQNEDPVARLRRLIEERQAETVQILRGWMEDQEERA
ncbi:flagellar basal-body MS-ring/collar protein FliF [Ostreiculturibacter nitratireducens]|uniref:flagellar basal-body MS-ring/collar protein FliF n=1 Tax=Ostreiculturibacter nitratireducens TaxID=3075226 RepID=UPI0031B61F5D